MPKKNLYAGRKSNNIDNPQKAIVRKHHEAAEIPLNFAKDAVENHNKRGAELPGKMRF
ncbi:MAG: hypothetical protein ACLFV2_07925 [Desulfurivibrionaceae bacterium]